MKRLNVAEKPETCPSCGFQPVGIIFYGKLHPDTELYKKIEDGTVILGGNCSGTYKPKWACKNCGCEFMHEERD